MSPSDRRARLDLDLLYVLARHPQATTTFVNGEVREMAALLPHVAVLAMSHTGERDPRPGGIPPNVGIGWAPAPLSASLAIGNVRAAQAGSRPYLDELRGLLVASRGRGRAYLRAAVTFAQASAAAMQISGPAGRPHLHAHFAGRGALAAHAIGALRGLAYSMTVHAYDIFVDNPHLRLLVRDAVLTVAISEFDRDEVLRLVPDADPERVRTIHVGVPAGELAQLAAGLRDPARPSDCPLLVSAGNLIPKKGMDVLLEATARLVAAGRRVRCEIIGDGALRSRLKRRARALGLDGTVRFLGALPPDEARRRIAEADVFVLACQRGPSGDIDGIPVVLMEAMACGVPTVSTRLSGIPELLVDRRRGRLAEPGSAESLATAIGEMLDRPDEAARWAAAGQRFVKREFDQATNARRLLAAIAAARGAG